MVKITFRTGHGLLPPSLSQLDLPHHMQGLGDCHDDTVGLVTWLVSPFLLFTISVEVDVFDDWIPLCSTSWLLEASIEIDVDVTGSLAVCAVGMSCCMVGI